MLQILANAIRKEKELKGVKIVKEKLKLLLFADVIIVDLIDLHIFTNDNQTKGGTMPFTIETTATIIKLNYLGINQTKKCVRIMKKTLKNS